MRHIWFPFWTCRKYIPASAISDPQNLKLSLKVGALPLLKAAQWKIHMPAFSLLPPAPHLQINGAIKQNGTTADMIFRIPRLIEHVSSIMTLEVRW